MNPTTGVIAVERSGFRAVQWPIREPGWGVRKPWRSLALSGALTIALTVQPSSGQGETTSESGKDQRYSSDFATTRVLAEQ